MQSDSPRTLKQTLKSLLDKIILLTRWSPVFLFFLVYFAVFMVVANAAYQINQTDLFKKNFERIKIGMSFVEVESLLGWPDDRHYNVRDKSNLLPKSHLFSWFRFSFSYSREMKDFWGKTVVNTPGREVWVYQDGLGNGDEAIIFDIKTGKVVQITVVPHLD